MNANPQIPSRPSFLKRLGWLIFGAPPEMTITSTVTSAAPAQPIFPTSVKQAGRRGGRWAGRSKEEIRSYMRMMAKARWRKSKELAEPMTQAPSLALEAHYGVWRKLWDDGLTVREMAAQIGLTERTVSNRISRLRVCYGWFPRRNRMRE